MNDINDSLVAEVLNQEDRNRQALLVLLGQFREKSGHHLAIQVRMGEVDSYVTSVPLRWVAEKVRFAADLPIFKESSEGSKRIEVDHLTIKMVQQRKPDWRRQQPMAAYLASRRHHKFPPLLLVAYQHWVYEGKKSDKWAADETATEHSLTLLGLDPKGTYWDIDDSRTLFYALDGQHRLMAILGLNELITKGRLDALDKEAKKTRKEPLMRDKLVKEICEREGGDLTAIDERIQHLMDERIGIEIVPAVTPGETYIDALHRLRQLFVDINEHAKRLTSSELAQLDEETGFRIVARRLMEEHRLLQSAKDAKGGALFDRVHTNSQTLSESSPSYTTLHTLSTVVENYLVESKTPSEAPSWRPLVKNMPPLRPHEESLRAATSAMHEYFEALAALPSHDAYIGGKPAGEIRKGPDPGGDDNILFRPIAQVALAEAIGKLLLRGQISLDTVTSVLTEQEALGQLRLSDPCTPWFGVLCDAVPPRKMRRHKEYEALCCRLFQYLLGGGFSNDVDREDLRQAFAKARLVSDDEAINRDGSTVRLEDVKLHRPWR